MLSDAQRIRTAALHWWRELDADKRQALWAAKYDYPIRMVTGRTIETIYREQRNVDRTA